MKRYLRLLLYILRFSFVVRLEYRIDFILNIVRSLVGFLLNLFTLEVIFAQTQMLAGWNREEALVLYGVFVCINELWYFLFFLNIMQIPDLIRLGELDKVLLMPVSRLFLISLRNFLIFSVPNLVFGILIIVYNLQKLDQGLSLLQAFSAVLLIANGLLVLYSLMLASSSLAFWTTQLRAFWEAYSMFTDAGKYPVTIFEGASRFVLTFILPIGVIFTFPAQALVHGLTIVQVLEILFFGQAIFFLARKIFAFGLMHYDSASA